MKAPLRRMALLERLMPVAEWANDQGPVVANVVAFVLLTVAYALFPLRAWRGWRR